MENIIEPDNFTEEQVEILDAMIDAEQDEEEDVNQSGGALPMEDLFDIQQIQQRFIRKFNTHGTDYTITMRPNVPRGNIMQFMSQAMTSILERITRDMEPTDLVRFILQSPDLSYPISLPFMPLHALTSERVLGEIEKVLQSFEEIQMNSPMQINIIHVVLPNGGARLRKKRAVRVTESLIKKKSVILIKNKDDLCCARAIVVAKAKLDSNPNWNSIRQGCPIQAQEAHELHDKAGVPKETCGIPEIKKFQEVLPGYQIVVLSKEHFNGIIYKGPEAPKQIYLYYYDNHYGVITSMTGFLGRSYYCTTCNKGYDHEDRHNCKVKCNCCHRKNCRVEEGTRLIWTSCQDCNRFFKGEGCYANHKERKKSKGTNLRSVCDNYKKCKLCKKIINCKGREMVSHRCGEIKCSVCKEFVNIETHKCFIQPHGQKEKKFVEEHRECVVETEQKYLFFDFECIQETGIHVPNLVIVHDMEGNETMFKGPNTRNEFCD